MRTSFRLIFVLVHIKFEAEIAVDSLTFCVVSKHFSAIGKCYQVSSNFVLNRDYAFMC